MAQSSDPRTPTLAVPGVIHVAPDTRGGQVVQLGVAAGWITPPGISQWSQELSLVARADVTPALRDELALTMPEDGIAPRRHPLAHKAAESLPFMGVTSEAVPKLLEKGIRVHTVGFDRVSSGFFYFAEGGKAEAIKVQGDLLEMMAPQLEKGEGTNAEIESHLDRFIDRVLLQLSGGQLDELRVELANALPRLSTDARGLRGVDLDAFEAEAAANAERGKKHEGGARKLAAALEAAKDTSSPVKVPLFGEAKPRAQAPIAVMLAGSATTLPGRSLWTVTGAPQEEKAPTPKPAAATARSPKPAAAAARSPKPAATAATRPRMRSAPTGAAAPIAPRPTPAPKPKPAAVDVEKKPEAVPAVAVTRIVAVDAEKTEPMKFEPKHEPEPVEAKAEEKRPVAPKPVEEKKPEEKKPAAEERTPEKEKAAAAKEVAPKEKKPPAPIRKAAETAPQKSNAALWIVLLLIIAAAAAFFLMKKH